MIRLHTTATCPRSRLVAFALEEAELEYAAEVHPAGYFQDTYGVPGPCLEDGDAWVLEPHAILRHVARTGASSGLSGHSNADRAEIDRWMDFLLGNVMAPLLCESRRSGRAVESVASDDPCVGRALRTIDDRLSDREFLVGATLSAADCAYLGLSRLASSPSLAGFQHLRRYLEALVARPAWAAATTRLIVAGS